MRVKYLVYAPPFSENSGGVIWQHNLVHTLNELGESAYLWPTMSNRRPTSIRQRIKLRLRPYVTSPDLNTPIASSSMLNEQCIVVYPEMVLGNPLNARNIARWLLYKPGLRWSYEFTKDEVFFRAGTFSDLPEVTGGAQDLSMWRVNRSYTDLGQERTHEVAYLIRKGDRKSRIPQTEDQQAIKIDGKSHEEIAAVFNRTKMFISYDEATMYSQYAAICGCISVVVPGLFNSRREWASEVKMGEYGVAYGLADSEIQHAIDTRDKLIKVLDERELRSLTQVKAFVRRTKKHFFDID